MSLHLARRRAPARRHAGAGLRETALARLPRGWALVASLLAVLSVAVVVPYALDAEPAASVVPFAPTDPLPVTVQAPPTPVGVQGPGTPAGDSRLLSIDVDGVERKYFVLPALGLGPDERAALLVVLHQDVGSAREIQKDLNLDGLRRKGVTLAYPAGIGGSWNAGRCCNIALQRGVDDVAFVNAVLDDVGRYTPVDRDRRALLGYSGGGMLMYRLLCESRPDLVAAVEVSGSLEVDCDDGLRVPDLLAIHGEKDGSIGLTTSRYVNHLKMSPRSVDETATAIGEKAGCEPRRTSTLNGIDLWRYTGCRGGANVEFQIVPDAGHGWEDIQGAPRATAFLLPRLAPSAAR